MGYVSLKDRFKPKCPVTENVKVTRVDMTSVLTGRGDLDTETDMHTWRAPQAHDGGGQVMPLQAMECQRLPGELAQKLREKQRTDSPPSKS